MTQEPYYRHLARIEWSHAKRAATVEELLDRIRFNQKDLVPFDEVRRRLRLRHRFYRGKKQVPLDNIVGSVGRYQDFTRTFMPRKEKSRDRWQRISALMSATGIPPIQLYKVGDAYFVADGNHRVSVARVHGADSIEADVWDFPTPAHVSDDATIDEIILEAERLDFLEKTGLDELRPNNSIRFTEPGRYIELEYQIALYQKVISEIDGEPCPYEKAVTDWYDMVYEPTVQIIQRENILQYFPNRTESDLFAWVSKHQRRLSKRYGLPVSVQEVARKVGGKGPMAWLRRLFARTEV